MTFNDSFTLSVSVNAADVASDIALIKLVRTLDGPIKSLQNM